MDAAAVEVEVVADANAIDRLGSIFASDVLLASQFNDTRRGAVGDVGIRKLLFAILEDEIRCFLAGNDPDAGRWRRRLCEEARVWIFDREAYARLTFDSICEGLGIGADYLRERLAGLEAGIVEIDRLPRRSPSRAGRGI